MAAVRARRAVRQLEACAGRRAEALAFPDESLVQQLEQPVGLRLALGVGPHRVAGQSTQRRRLGALPGNVPDQQDPAAVAGGEHVVEVAADGVSRAGRPVARAELDARDLGQAAREGDSSGAPPPWPGRAPARSRRERRRGSSRVARRRRAGPARPPVSAAPRRSAEPPGTRIRSVRRCRTGQLDRSLEGGPVVRVNAGMSCSKSPSKAFLLESVDPAERARRPHPVAHQVPLPAAELRQLLGRGQLRSGSAQVRLRRLPPRA